MYYRPVFNIFTAENFDNFEMSGTMNINEYFERINYSGSAEPTLDTLAKLQKQHFLNVPFENLDIKNEIEIKLDLDRIYSKVVENGRGGFCYELNGLFYELLKAIGFDSKMVSARVFNPEKKEFGAEFDHMVIITELDGGQYISDVGFGEFAFNPLKIELNTIQEDPRGEFKIEKYDHGHLLVSFNEDGNWIPKYIFSQQPRYLSEYSGMCRFHQTSPESHFTGRRLCSIATENGRITITGNELKIKNGAGTEEYQITDDADFREKLKEYFGMEV